MQQVRMVAAIVGIVISLFVWTPVFSEENTPSSQNLIESGAQDISNSAFYSKSDVVDNINPIFNESFSTEACPSDSHDTIISSDPDSNSLSNEENAPSIITPGQNGTHEQLSADLEEDLSTSSIQALTTTATGSSSTGGTVGGGSQFGAFSAVSPEVQLSTGAASFTIPIQVPPGRKGAQPELEPLSK